MRWSLDSIRASVQAARLAENEGVQIKTYSIIYNAIEEVKSAMEGMLEPKIQEKVVANVEIGMYLNSIKLPLPVVMYSMEKYTGIPRSGYTRWYRGLSCW